MVVKTAEKEYHRAKVINILDDENVKVSSFNQMYFICFAISGQNRMQYFQTDDLTAQSNPIFADLEFFQFSTKFNTSI